MNESNYYFHDEQYFFASTSSQVLPYKTILNKVTECSDESFTYADQNGSSSISTSSQVSPYETMLNTVTERSDESFTYTDQNVSSSISTSSQVLPYETILNTVTERSDKSFNYADQNVSSSTLLQVPVIFWPFRSILLVSLLELEIGLIFIC
ncbi:hypothetical protein F8M41_014470 [Gigaspora margarita]|uniref:Uncharacterized protein n=1 Tax=Gigaspora margarita TaxID=4874 RepID=A0A8H3WX41_GIGMA|nr:hypothetical protein F8M41_014470 [Gigaspora margarita]